MIKEINEEYRELFRVICAEDESAGGDGEFSTGNEKRLHRVLKRFTLETERGSSLSTCQFDGFESRVGSRVADLLLDGTIFEIQTGSMRPLAKKLEYYLENTDYRIVLICPLKKQTDILRIDRESGELTRKRRSPKRESVLDRLYDLIYIGEMLSEPRVTIRFIEIASEEQRYSERVRNRKSGAFEAEFFPRELIGIIEYTEPCEFLEFIPEHLSRGEGFSAAEYSSAVGITGRRLYNTLNFFCSLGILRREKVGNKYKYRVVCEEET